MSIKKEIKNYVSPTLHPANITGLESYTNNTRGLIEHAAEALGECYQSVVAVIDARKKIKLDDSRTERAKVIQTAKLADQYSDRARQKCEASWKRLTDGINYTEKELTKPVEEYAGIGNVATEIRAHLKGMKQGQRMQFLNTALENGDERTIRSAIGAPEFLSGMTAPEHSHFTRLYHTKTSPGLVARLEAMKGAREKLEQARDVFIGEMEKAVGANRFEVERLKAASNAAEAALVMKQFEPMEN